MADKGELRLFSSNQSGNGGDLERSAARHAFQVANPLGKPQKRGGMKWFSKKRKKEKKEKTKMLGGDLSRSWTRKWPFAFTKRRTQ